MKTLNAAAALVAAGLAALYLYGGDYETSLPWGMLVISFTKDYFTEALDGEDSRL